MIQDEELRGRLIGKSFSQLLCNPGASGMTRNVEVNNLSPVMANNKEAVQQLEADRRDREEIHGSDRFAMIAKKGQPAPRKFWISGCSLHPTGDAALGYIEAQHEQLAVDAGSTPGWVLCHHPKDQITNFLRQSFSTDMFFTLEIRLQ
jgi:hypothetical protein